jgi:hypothetical protein
MGTFSLRAAMEDWLIQTPLHTVCQTTSQWEGNRSAIVSLDVIVDGEPSLLDGTRVRRESQEHSPNTRIHPAQFETLEKGLRNRDR